MKDFFISYNRHDKAWAEWIAWTLEEAGSTVVIQAWDFRPGGNFVLDMHKAVTETQATIAVLSETFLKSDYTAPEWAAAFAQDPQGTQRKLIPVRVGECQPTGLLAQIVYVDLLDCETGEAQQRLLAGVSTGRLKPTSSPPYPGKASERSLPNPVPFPGVTVAHGSTVPVAPVSLALSAYDAQTWVGRDALLQTLTQKLESGYRVLVLTGMTGIGKTALAEHLVVNVQGRGVPFHRLNFDDRGQGRDFLSGALSLLPKLGEVVTTADQQDPQKALQHLLTTLRSKPFLVQIDSLELLLEGSEVGGWSAFQDPLWVDFLQQLLAGEGCQSQLLITTQAVPEELEAVGSRYSRCWDMQVVSGLAEEEQLALFRKNGLEPTAEASETLKRLGSLYDGHPLVLQVIAKDILSRPFNGHVLQYWQHYEAEFNEGERDRRQGNSPRALQLRVKQRVEASLRRLPVDALRMVCRASVYRRPVPEGFWEQQVEAVSEEVPWSVLAVLQWFWLKMVGELPKERRWSALEVLRSHNLVEEVLRGDGVLLLRQHNLVRGVARNLLRSVAGEWREAHLRACLMWLEDYEAESGAPNIEQLRGQLEAFHHACEVEEWEGAKEVLLDEGVGWQLHTWSYYRETLPLYERLLGKVGAAVDVGCKIGIGRAYQQLSDYPQAIEHYQQSLETARELNDRGEEGRALNGLGLAYGSQGDNAQAVEYHQQSLTIARELGNRQGEGITLGYLGNAYSSQSDYAQAIAYYEQSLTIAGELGNRQGEGDVLGNLGIAYGSLGDDYAKTIEYQQQHLAIARELGNRQGESIALVNWGIALLKLEQYSEAQPRLQAALESSKALGYRHNEAEALLRLAELYQQTGHSDRALDHCTQALALSRELGIPLLKECEALLATLQAETGAEH